MCALETTLQIPLGFSMSYKINLHLLLVLFFISITFLVYHLININEKAESTACKYISEYKKRKN
ncbi:hypothetical protein GCM10007323_04110 [Lactobacillus apis]|nr:hypothetical protein GCM10007323_04110 [Lactobacillus apis]